MLRRRRAAARKLTLHEADNLTIGAPGNAFLSEAARRRAWKAYREELLGKSRPGRRPAAWWDYEVGEEKPWPVDPRDWDDVLAWQAKFGAWEPEAVRLLELGELTDDEVRAINDGSRMRWDGTTWVPKAS